VYILRKAGLEQPSRRFPKPFVPTATEHRNLNQKAEVHEGTKIKRQAQ
jgi:hypothetical protein